MSYSLEVTEIGNAFVYDSFGCLRGFVYDDFITKKLRCYRATIDASPYLSLDTYE